MATAREYLDSILSAIADLRKRSDKELALVQETLKKVDLDLCDVCDTIDDLNEDAEEEVE